MGRGKRWAIGAGLTVVLGAAGGAFALSRLGAPRPVGQTGPEAEALGRQLAAAMDDAGWARTGAVKWTFIGRVQHLWDRRRNFDRVRFGDAEVLLDIARRDGVAREHGAPVEGPRKAKLLEKAFAAWTNDSFWLNPLAKLFDPGATLSKVPLVAGDQGAAGLLVSYGNVGLTPGDGYLWIVPQSGLPEACRFYTSVIPVQGVKVSFEAWIRLRTGVNIATRHRIAFASVDLTDVDGAATLSELTGGEDPFAAIGNFNVPPRGGP
jgi:hypothetical protein